MCHKHVTFDSVARDYRPSRTSRRKVFVFSECDDAFLSWAARHPRARLEDVKAEELFSNDETIPENILGLGVRTQWQ